MDYAKVENNQVVQIGLPSTGILKDGSTVSGYNLLDTEILRNEGWLPYEENKPDYNEITQYLEFVCYTILADKVVANYIAKDIAVQIVDEPIDDEKVAMAEAIIDLNNRLNELEGRV